MQYLNTLAQLECQVFTLNRVKKRLNKQIKKLAIAKKYSKPIENRSFFDFDGDTLKVIAILSFVLGLFIHYFIFSKLGYYDFNNEKIREFSKTHPIWSFYVGVGHLFLTPLWVSLSYIFVSSASARKYNRTKYQKELVQYQHNIAADALRVQKELQVKTVLCAQRDAVNTQYETARNALDVLYAVGIIEPEYRDFAAVTTFYSYFRKEYCDRLAGPNQAYDRYDQALKIGEIINKLDVIINKLDEIIKNQAYLAELLRDSNNTLHRIEQGNEKMLQSMEAVEENSNLTEYNTRCAAESSKATALLTLFNTLKQNKDE